MNTNTPNCVHLIIFPMNTFAYLTINFNTTVKLAINDHNTLNGCKNILNKHSYILIFSVCPLLSSIYTIHLYQSNWKYGNKVTITKLYFRCNIELHKHKWQVCLVKIERIGKHDFLVILVSVDFK